MLEKIQTRIIEHEENQIVQAVQNCGISVDKEELMKALMYDRQQYDKGYADAKAEQRWIPCDERLPEDDVEVLATVTGVNGKRYVEQGSCISGTWCLAYDHLRFGSDARVIAWMPLPEPYCTR